MKIEISFTSAEAEKHYGPPEKLYATDFSAGIDLRAATDTVITILPSEQVMVPTGIKINMLTDEFRIPMAAMAMPRSGRGSRDGLVLGNTLGLIDQDYQGEIILCCWHRPTDSHINIGNARVGGAPISIEPWERIAQLVFTPIFRITPVVVGAFSSTTYRGTGGFGSTG